MSRDINDLCPSVRLRLEKLQAAASAATPPIGFQVVYTLRTEAEQRALFAQGRKTVDETNRLRRDAGMPPITAEENRHIITKVMTSMHQFGCAFDIAVMKGGKIDWNDTPLYMRLGEIGESLGLRWGGRFSFKDWGHFEYTGGLSVVELKEGKRPSA